jgi:hypothetical protein
MLDYELKQSYGGRAGRLLRTLGYRIVGRNPINPTGPVPTGPYGPSGHYVGEEGTEGPQGLDDILSREHGGKGGAE